MGECTHHATVNVTYTTPDCPWCRVAAIEAECGTWRRTAEKLEGEKRMAERERDEARGFRDAIRLIPCSDISETAEDRVRRILRERDEARGELAKGIDPWRRVCEQRINERDTLRDALRQVHETMSEMLKCEALPKCCRHDMKVTRDEAAKLVKGERDG